MMLLVPRSPPHTKAQKYNQKPPPFFHRALSSLLFQKKPSRRRETMGTRGYPPTEEKSFSFAAHKRERKGRERGGRSRERRERGRGEREDGGEKERRRRLNLGPPPRPPVLLPPPPLPPNGLASAEEREGGGRQMATLHSLSFRLLAFSSPFGFPKGDFTKPKQREAGSQKGRRTILAPAD